MKKIILVATLGLIIFSCNKDADSTGLSSKENNEELNDLEMKASYAYGISLGQNAEMYQQQLGPENQLDYDQVKEGISDFIKNPEELEAYAFGLTLGKQIDGAMTNPIIQGRLDKDEIIEGFMDFVKKNDLRLPLDSMALVMDDFYQHQLSKTTSKNIEEGDAYLKSLLEKDGYQSTENGIVYKVIKEGEGPKVQEGDRILVKYEGKHLNGEVFDGTDKNNRGEPIEFVLSRGGLIQGWVDGIQLMSKGAIYELNFPSELGYGDIGSGSIRPGETLIFNIELVDILPQDAPVRNPGQPGVDIKVE